MEAEAIRERDEEESAEEKTQRLWDELYASMEGIVARPLPTLSVVDGAVTIVAPGASMFERYGSYYRLRRQNEGGVELFQVQCMLGCGSKWANVATKGRDRAVEFSNQVKHLRAVHAPLLTLADQGGSGVKRKGAGEVAGDAEVEEAGPKFRGSEERTRFAKLVLTNGLPTSFCESPGWVRYANEHGIETYSRKTLVSVMNGLRTDLIVKPREAFLREALKTVKMTVQGAVYEFETPLSGLGCDGWDRLGGGGATSRSLQTGSTPPTRRTSSLSRWSDCLLLCAEAARRRALLLLLLCVYSYDAVTGGRALLPTVGSRRQ